MRWQTIKKLPPAQFKRLVGVEKQLYEMMVAEAKPRIGAEQPSKIAGKNVAKIKFKLVR